MYTTAHLEGLIAIRCLAQECITFCSKYLIRVRLSLIDPFEIIKVMIIHHIQKKSLFLELKDAYCERAVWFQY